MPSIVNLCDSRVTVGASPCEANTSYGCPHSNAGGWKKNHKEAQNAILADAATFKLLKHALLRISCD